MLQALGSVSAPGREGRANEDGCGVAGRFAFVIDGATGLGDTPLLDAPSDAAWLTTAMIDALTADAGEARDPADLLARAAARVEERFVSQRLRAPAERYEIPSAAVLVAAFDAGGVEIADLGDCGIYIADAKGLARYGGTAEGRALERENARRMVGQGGGRGPEVVAFLRGVRDTANTPAGYAIFAPDAACADRTRVHRHPWDGAGEALLLTDGYEAAVDDYGLYDAQTLMEAARSDLRGPLDALRAVERADPDLTRFPRFKQSDDATALLVRFTAVQASGAKGAASSQ